MMMTCGGSGSARRCLSVSRPSISGITMSSSATSNASSRTACSAALPSPTHTTWWPRPRRNVAENLREVLFVLGDENSNASAAARRAVSRSCGARREEDAKHAALADDAVDLDASAVLGDDRVADRQTEPRAAARRLRREERLEDLRSDRRGECPCPRSITSAIDSPSSSSDRVRSVIDALFVASRRAR